MKLYVGNLQYSSTEDDLKSLFSSFGEVESVSLITDRHSGNSKGFAFIEMPNNANADQAIKELNGSNFQGRMIKVNQSQPKSNSSSNRSYRGR